MQRYDNLFQKATIMRSTLPLRIWVLCLFAAIALPCSEASAWWAKGHENVAEASLAVLPPDMPRFFRDGVAAVRLSSTDPDWWANKALPELRAAEAPNHFIDLELLKGTQLLRSRDLFNARCRELRVFPDNVGFLPYSAQEWYQRLVLALAEYRKHPDDKLVQAKVLYIAGVLSHYTADATQPLHTTIDFDGRANADGASPRSGIHARVDALLEVKLPAPTGVKIESSKDLFATIEAAIMESHGLVNQVYALENKLPNPADTGAAPLEGPVQQFATERYRAAVKLTATVWYSAWIQSMDIEVPGWR